VSKFAAVIVILAIVAGGALGGFAALQFMDSPPPPDEPEAPPTVTAPPPVTPVAPMAILQPDGETYYLGKLRTSGVMIDAMTPLLLTPRADEKIPDHCPDRLAVLRGADTHADVIAPYLAAFGDVVFQDDGGPETVYHAATNALREQWRILHTLVKGPVTTPPLRIIVKHYPRPTLPGRCFTIQTTIFNVPDTYFDREWLQQNMPRSHEAAPVRGLLYEFRKTYQTEGDRLRLIEAQIEVHTHVLMLPRRRTVLDLMGVASVGKVGPDLASVDHFIVYGGGVRSGMLWVDGSAGQGEAEPWARAYSIVRESMEGKPRVREAALSAEAEAALRKFVERA